MSDADAMGNQQAIVARATACGDRVLLLIEGMGTSIMRRGVVADCELTSPQEVERLIVQLQECSRSVFQQPQADDMTAG